MSFGRNLRWTALAFLLWSLAYNLIAPLLPLYARALGASSVGVGVVGAIGLAGAFLFVFPLSFVSDRMGRRAALLAGWTLSGVGLLAVAAARSWLGLLPGAFCAMGAVAALPTLNTLALEELAPADRARGFSLLYAASPLGALVGAAVSGWLATTWSLRAAALVAGVVGLGATLAILGIRPGHPAGRTVAQPAAPAAPRRSALPTLAFGVVAAGGFLLVALPGNFITPFLRDVSRQSFVAVGLSNALLFAGQLGWSLLLALCPANRVWLRVGRGTGALVLPAATLLAIAVCLAANGAFGLLLPIPGLTVLALLLRGSQYSLQSLGSALLGDVVNPGPGFTTRLTLLSGLLGLGAAGAPVAGGWLYGRGPTLPFVVTGVAASFGALVLLLAWAVLPRKTAPDTGASGAA